MKLEPDWIGRPMRKWRWKRLKFMWGRWSYCTNACGETLHRWFVFDCK